ncbi:hypothetical protein Scep_030037 [Stephania cephalantha]|uniref:Pentatricopeptide repeat-containing protein n=1 Tax=Stephania cephalantha TaxID=152367 RepID=A0AAP0HGI3_9MAGN
MFRHCRGSLLFASACSVGKPNWDPTVSLNLAHPTLVLLEKCRTRTHFKQILAQMIRVNLSGQTFPMSRLLVFSAISHPENLDMAILLFNHFTPRPNLFIYDVMISALSFSSTQSFGLYCAMLRSYIYPDEHTLLSLLKAVSSLSHGKQIHGHAVVMGFSSYSYLLNSLIKMYLGDGEIFFALQLFEEMPEQDAVSFNIMISWYSKEGYSLKAIAMFHKMVDAGLLSDDFTMVGLLISCGKLGDARLGKSIHASIERRKPGSSWNSILCNALLDMYVKCEDMQSAIKIFNICEEEDIVTWNTIIAGYARIGELKAAQCLFDKMPCRDLVSWNSLIAGYAQNQNLLASRNLFKDMIADGFEPDNSTIVSLVSAAAESGALDQGRWLHGWLVRAHIKLDAFLGSALLDMYCKCGTVEQAFMVFNCITEKDVAVWTAMIAGFACHGYGIKALTLFWKMQRHVMPNYVTFIAVLTACSHSGMVDEGLKLFNSMKASYGIEPLVEHYGCLVDLLARAGRLSEAKDVIENMPVKPSRSIWGSMLNVCKVHGNIELAEIALTELSKLEPDKEGSYILLSNMYSACGRWNCSSKIRKKMEFHRLKKTAGCSSLVLKNRLHEFVAAGKRNSRSEDIYSILNLLKGDMKTNLDSSVDDLQQTVNALID